MGIGLSNPDTGSNCSSICSSASTLSSATMCAQPQLSSAMAYGAAPSFDFMMRRTFFDTAVCQHPARVVISACRHPAEQPLRRHMHPRRSRSMALPARRSIRAGAGHRGVQPRIRLSWVTAPARVLLLCCSEVDGGMIQPSARQLESLFVWRMHSLFKAGPRSPPTTRASRANPLHTGQSDL